jgi:hypothetical protein
MMEPKVKQPIVHEQHNDISGKMRFGLAFDDKQHFLDWLDEQVRIASEKRSDMRATAIGNAVIDLFNKLKSTP